MTFSAGDVVLVPFPYRDRLAERARPAVVVSADTYNQHGDVVVAAITSHTPRAAMDYALRDWAAAGLKLPSTVRMLLATVASARILLHVGHLTEQGLDRGPSATTQGIHVTVGAQVRTWGQSRMALPAVAHALGMGS